MFKTTLLPFLFLVVCQCKDLYSGPAECADVDTPYSTDDPYNGQELTARWAERCRDGNAYINGLECQCDGGKLSCPGNSEAPEYQHDRDFCMSLCICPNPTDPDAVTDKPKQPANSAIASPWEAVCTATSCDKLDACGGSCLCVATGILSFFWFSGACRAQSKPIFHTGLRRRQITPVVANASISNGASGSTNGAVAAACNSSYVSYACANSADGIVYEPLTNWLGAILPAGADIRNPPSVPQEWLGPHGFTSDPNHGTS